MLKTGYILTFLLLAASMFGCQSQQVKTADTEAKPAVAEQKIILPFPESDTPQKELDEEIIYHYLAGAIGMQRGKFDTSYEHFLRSAQLSKDATAAEKAARIALHQKNNLKALRATNLWQEYAPNSIHARQLGALLNIRDGNIDQAIVQFEAMLQIAKARSIPGFERIADLLATEKDSSNSIFIMQKIVSKHPEEAHAYYALALLATAKNNSDIAMDALAKSIKTAPNWDKPIILQAQLLITQKDHPQAISILRKGIAQQPGSASLPLALGRLLTQQKDYKKALIQFQQATKLEPDNLNTTYLIGMLATQTEEWETARKAWNKLILSGDKEQKNEARYFLAQMEDLQGNTTVAQKLYAAVQESKIHTDAQLQLARMHAENGQIKEAREIYQKLRVLNYHKSPQFYLMEASTLRRHNQPAEAMSVYSVAVAAFPDDVDLRYNRGLAASEQDDIKLAIADFLFILEKKPEHADTLNALGYTLADQTDRFDEAFIYISKANKLKPDSPAILDSMGWVYYRLGDHKQALNYLRRAAKANQDAEIAAHLGEVLWVSGEQKEAQEIWSKALTAQPDSKKLKEVMQRLQ